MVRTQVQLTDDQAQALKKLAARQGVSLAKVMQQAVERLLQDDEEERERRWTKFFEMTGKFSSGVSDLSERHDDYLAEAYYDWHDDDEEQVCK